MDIEVINYRDIEARERAMHRAIMADSPATSDDMVREFKEAPDPVNTQGSRKNNFTFSGPIDPGQRRCKNTEYT